MTSPSISIEDVPLNSFHKLLTLRSGGGSFVDGYVLSIIGVALAQITTSLSLSSFWEGLIAASALIGIFFGGFLGGWLTDRLGRKRLFFVGPILFILASVAQFWSDSAEAIFIFRLVIGIAVGIEYPVATSLLVEFMPKKYRGPRLAMLTILWFAGAAAAYIMGELILRTGSEEAWRWVLASSAVAGLALFIVRVGTPESPRWLLNKGRTQEAEQVVKSVYGNDFSLKNLPEESPNYKISVWSLIYSGYAKRMLFIIVFWTCCIVPLFAVYAFAPKVLAAMNVKGESISIGSILITLFFVVGCLVSTRLINVVGRRNLLLYSFAVSGLALLGLGASDDNSGMWILAFFAIYALFIGGAQVLTLVYPNEIFPTEIRAFAVGAGTSISRIGAAVGTYLVPMSLASLGIAQTMYVAAGITFFGLLLSWMLAPETRSLNLQQAASLG
ncbi:MFS transporter [Pseudomonas sp. yb_2]|uniref:MFS transporter n=1 Tax=Pseudomonas sp. yb_2 TaxID=3367218 RepID=UPI00370C5A82